MATCEFTCAKCGTTFEEERTAAFSSPAPECVDVVE